MRRSSNSIDPPSLNPLIQIFSLLVFASITGCHERSNDGVINPGVENIQQVAYVALRFRKEHDRLPESMREITEFNGTTPTLDHWKNEIFYRRLEEGFVIESAGPDGELGTRDDPKTTLHATEHVLRIPDVR